MGIWNRINIELTKRRIVIVARAVTRCDLRDRVGFEYLRLKLTQLNEELERRTHREMVGICRRYGCDMQSVGGCNAGCHDDCCCSVPVHTCSRCKACDFGDNDEADDIRRICADEHPLVNGRIIRASERAA